MTQDLPDLGQGRACSQELRPGGMPESVRMGSRDPGALRSDQYDAGNIARSESLQWCIELQEHGIFPAVGTSMVQIISQGGPHVVRQRQFLLAGSLATDQDLPGPPVHVLQQQGRYFAGSQLQPAHENQNCVVQQARHGPAVARSQQGIDGSSGLRV